MSYKAPLASTADWGIVKIGSGISVSNGVISTSVASPAYGYFYSTATQTNPVIDTTNILTLNITEQANNTSVVAGSRITVANTGVYNIVFTASVNKTDGGRDSISFWLAKNSTNVSNSRQDLIINQNTDTIFVTGNYLLTLASLDYIGIYWSSPDIDMRLLQEAAAVAPVRPAVPSARITISQIS